jgi:hypothetical protein
MHALVTIGSDVALAITNEQDDMWYLDLGAMAHMASTCTWFVEYKPLEGRSVLLSNNSSIQVAGKGMVEAIHYTHQHPECVWLLNILHVLAILKNLLSALRLVQAGLVVEIGPQVC